MIRNTSEHNETVKPNDFEMERLRAALPEYFDGDGNFMIDRLQQALQDGDVDLTREGYELKFLGKSYAKYLTSTKTETVVVPDLEHNSKPENKDSENLYIVGDNLDALKHLLGSYAGKVKCIYIDPPYNTGSDGFVYNDDFGFTSAQLVDKIGLSEDEAERVLDLQGKSSHSAWLTFMYPRLQLAKELLADDGVIFISIDDNEQTNLKLLCDEIFGEQNFISDLVWKSKSGGANDSGQIAIDHEYIIAYARNGMNTNLLPDPFAQASTQYNRSDENGRYSLERLDKQNLQYSASMDYDLVGPDGTVFSLEHKDPSSPNAIWRWSQDTVRERLDELVFENGHVYTKNYEKDAGKSRSLLTDERFGRSRTGTTDMTRLFEGKAFFKNPKPVKLLEHLLRISVPTDCIVLDFFSGSGSTAHAVMDISAETGKTVRYFMIQLNEQIDPSANRYSKAAYSAGYRTIDEIGRERIKRAAAKIKDETGADIDYGFKLYRLNEPSGQVLDDLLTFDPKQDGTLLAGDYVSKFNLNGTPGHDTVLATWLVADGHGLVTGAQQVTLADYVLDVCGDSAYIISPGLTSDDVVELVRLLENGALAVSRVVVFGYSVTFGVMHELKKNLSVLKSGRTVSVIERL
ncbi:site-specific DNA-methyltransferase [Corynebacterium diphtheriae]|uniref:site-specific DNA-methyltransferase n=1 Tax=Corynebacterium diphtheriae TaxID=1717 RepID=UPI0002602919|nr:site-specific DNA-methyltransferase [Corynebacterium diphtheriae]EIK55178.1 DNA methylase [Corynebacterium diphtheriae bv. intermedius str. NCTC 5011]OWM39152.1 DNA methyltransferase [Corynebacterium diphtheriae bv. intermedius]CAB0620136.1 site-specific DNA-methyltransferase [Corynebacterium diphtheriae]CAB0669527.1 site-specific DNA-methyltransferase [Corynebacterium diphtheriae]CAB0971928.1 site-specific DNA-methyltransferase [Corynebacterium diphtheriae]